MVEQLPLKQLVVGSIPTRSTTIINNNMSNTNNNTTAVRPVTEAVSSLLDIEGSTVSLEVYKNNPMFVLNKASRYPFSFGIHKARLILKHVEQLKTFVATNGASI